MNICLEMKDIIKSFGNVRALSGINLVVKTGEIHAICGENGAGKSTLMKVLSGFYSDEEFEGQILLNGVPQKFQNTRQSERAGIAIIFQELALVPEMSVFENIFLGHEKTKGGLIDWDRAYSQAKKVLDEVKLDINPSIKVSQLGVGEQQLVEIAKALAKNANILILDEPTAALTESEADNLLGILEKLKRDGKTCLYISHRLKEVFQISDRISIIRDGKSVLTADTKELNEAKLITHMVGRELQQIYPRQERTRGKKVLEVKNWTVADEDSNSVIIDDISFELHEGEVLGIAGLMGAGRTELAMSIFGAFGKKLSGEVFLDGKKLNINKEYDAIQSGLALVSEDRKRNGLVLSMDIKQNSTLASLSKISNFLGVIDKNKEIFESKKYVDSMRVKTPSLEQITGNLSGGNQQKVVISKWLMNKPRVLILDEPTRGIDVGAKFEIYSIVNKLLDDGVCVIMVSSELPEVLGMSDRILVMNAGKFTGEFCHRSATQEKIMHCATGHVL